MQDTGAEMTSAVALFSGGIGSWAAAKRAKASYDELVLLFTDTKTEDEDLYRFLHEAADNVNAELVVIADGRDVWQVFNDEKFIGNTRVDICSRILKRDLARDWIDKRYDSVDVVMGIDWTESHRYDRAKPRWEPHRLVAPLLDDPVLDKHQAADWLAEQGIRQPRLYDWSPHNNCGGFCVKAGHAQFKALLANMPERFAYHEAKEQEFRQTTGKNVAILRDRTGGTTTPLTMKAFRERIENDPQLSFDDFGGCGCML